MSLVKIQRSLDFISNEAKLLSSIKENNIISKRWPKIKDSLSNSIKELEVINRVNSDLHETLKNTLVENNKKETQLRSEADEKTNFQKQLNSKLVVYQSEISSYKKNKSSYDC